MSCPWDEVFHLGDIWYDSIWHTEHQLRFRMCLPSCLRLVSVCGFAAILHCISSFIQFVHRLQTTCFSQTTQLWLYRNAAFGAKSSVIKFPLMLHNEINVTLYYPLLLFLLFCQCHPFVIWFSLHSCSVPMLIA